jgi:hypothetical protein
VWHERRIFKKKSTLIQAEVIRIQQKNGSNLAPNRDSPVTPGVHTSLWAFRPKDGNDGLSPARGMGRQGLPTNIVRVK